MIDASQLSQRVTIMAPSVTRDGYGSQVVTYVDRGQAWANVKFAKGARALDHGELWLQNSIVVTCRERSVLNDHCRLQWDGKLYQIDSYNRDRRQGSVTITATRIDTGTPDSESSNP